jgi:SOS-response transcriptional repressor LexA
MSSMKKQRYSKRPVTARQRQVLDAIVAFMADQNYAPTLRELGGLLGIKSTTAVTDHLRALEHKGWVVMTKNQARSLTLTGKAKAYYHPDRGDALALKEIQFLVEEYPDPLEGTVTAAIINRLRNVLQQIKMEA